MLVLVTGASAGFGAAIARRLVSEGHRVIGTARRLEKLQALRKELGEEFIPMAFDVADRKACEQASQEILAQYGTVDVLINNAGLALGLQPAHQGNLDDWETMIHTNVLGLVYMTRLFLAPMVAQRAGYIINLGSIAGSWPYAGSNIYGATKAFVRQFSLNLRTDLKGTGVRVTNLEPGLCGDTEFSNVRFKGDNAKAASVYHNIDYVTPEDIADIVSYLVHTPKHVNINTLEVMPTAQCWAGMSVVDRDFEPNV